MRTSGPVTSPNSASASARGIDVEPQRRAQRGLERGERDLAVALREVRVADVRERARDLHRQVERGALDEQVDVDVAAVRAGRHRVRALVAGDRDAHRAQERREREGDHALAVVDDRQQTDQPRRRAPRPA